MGIVYIFNALFSMKNRIKFKDLFVQFDHSPVKRKKPRKFAAVLTYHLYISNVYIKLFNALVFSLARVLNAFLTDG